MEEQIEDHGEVLTNEESQELVLSSIKEEEKTAAEAAMWTLLKFTKVLQIAQILKDRSRNAIFCRNAALKSSTVLLRHYNRCRNTFMN